MHPTLLPAQGNYTSLRVGSAHKTLVCPAQYCSRPSSKILVASSLRSFLCSRHSNIAFSAPCSQPPLSLLALEAFLPHVGSSTPPLISGYSLCCFSKEEFLLLCKPCSLKQSVSLQVSRFGLCIVHVCEQQCSSVQPSYYG